MRCPYRDATVESNPLKRARLDEYSNFNVTGPSSMLQPPRPKEGDIIVVIPYQF